MNTVIGAAKPSSPVVSAPSADLLRAEGLRVVFPTATGQSRTVLRGIDLSVKPGEVLGLVGRAAQARQRWRDRSLASHRLPGASWLDG